MPMKSTDFSRPQHHTFARCLHDASRGSRSMWETFSDFLTLTYLSLSQAAHKLRHGEMDPAKEEEYLRIYQSHKHPKKFPEAFSHVVMALDRERYDFIGTVAGELELLNSWNGQFFTPKHVCDLMAQMTIGEAAPDPDRRMTICEPACGAGAMVIATANVLQERNFMPWNYWITAIDIDVKMFMAAYIQLTLCAIPANVIWGNTLSLEEHRNETTLVGILHPYRKTAVERAEDEARTAADALRKQQAALAAAHAAREALILKNHGQLDLFA
jgi:type I restriction-modification system DNA methylase subunit